ncbi:MAG: hypothetical protein CL904_06655 [Dehalococcoidia bacterium]|nr:hypothetical protein [Dehalococcoidia bacterium]MQG16191.1 hypothetical protein [SAR202 cluster bacterium]
MNTLFDKYRQFIKCSITALGIFAIIVVTVGCTEITDKEVVQDEQYSASEDYPIIVLPDSQIKIQFIEVFDESKCSKGMLCNVSGKGKIMIGITGPGLMPFPTELTVGVPSNALFGYSLILKNIDRTESADSVELFIKKIKVQ